MPPGPVRHEPCCRVLHEEGLEFLCLRCPFIRIVLRSSASFMASGLWGSLVISGSCTLKLVCAARQPDTEERVLQGSLEHRWSIWEGIRTKGLGDQRHPTSPSVGIAIRDVFHSPSFCFATFFLSLSFKLSRVNCRTLSSLHSPHSPRCSFSHGSARPASPPFLSLLCIATSARSLPFQSTISRFSIICQDACSAR